MLLLKVHTGRCMGYSGLFVVDDHSSYVIYTCMQCHHLSHCPFHSESLSSSAVACAVSFACDSRVSEVLPVLYAMSGMSSLLGNPYTPPTLSAVCVDITHLFR